VKPICYDLYCGLGGWSDGFIAEGYQVVGFDIERHDYGTGGYSGELRIRDVRSIHGSELKDAACIVGSSPCQEFSYRAMPWKRAKALPPPYLGIELFNAQFRIQREAIEAAGHYIPMVVENVRGAQKWVGKAQANYGSFYMWGDVGRLGSRVLCVVNGELIGDRGVRPTRALKAPGMNWNEWKGWDGREETKPASVRPWGDAPQEGYKTSGMNWSDQTKRGQDFTRIAGRQALAASVESSGLKYDAESPSGHWTNPAEHEGVKEGGDWWNKECRKTGMAQYGSKSSARKRASAMIAKIPYPLALHIAQTFKPREA
jgi:hypothetical protein